MVATESINALTCDQEHALWHFRLGHSHKRLVMELHKYVNGVPKLPCTDILHSCTMCAQAKLHKSSRGPKEDHIVEACWQDIQIDFGFMVVQSSSKKSKSDPLDSAPTSRKCKAIVKALCEITLQHSAQSNKFSGSMNEDHPTTETASATKTAPPTGTSAPLR